MTMVEKFERALLGVLSPSGRRARLLILTYHRVLAERDPLLPDEPDAAAFSAQMDVLGTYCRVLTLPEAIKRLHSGTLPPRAACITFDDGYANNLHVAAPIMEARGLHATVFMAVEAIRSGIMWNDLVIEVVRAAKESLDVSALGQPPIDCASRPRAAVVNELLARMKYLPLAERWRLACQLFAVNARAEAPRLMMSEAEVAELARRDHDVGAHTVNHPILRELSEAEARREIYDSGGWLADVTGKFPPSFAYPNGHPDRDYDMSHARMVREAGFELAVSTAWGCATRRSDVYQLPRCAPWQLQSKIFPLRLAKNYLLHTA